MQYITYKECTDEEREAIIPIKETVKQTMESFRHRLSIIERPSAYIRNRYVKNILHDLYKLRPMLIHYFWACHNRETEEAHDNFFRNVDECISKLYSAMGMTARNFSFLLDEINSSMEMLTNRVLLDLDLTTQEKGEIIEEIDEFRKISAEQVQSSINFYTEIKRAYVGIKTKHNRDFNMLETRTYIHQLIEKFEKALPPRLRSQIKKSK